MGLLFENLMFEDIDGFSIKFGLYYLKSHFVQDLYWTQGSCCKEPSWVWNHQDRVSKRICPGAL